MWVLNVIEMAKDLNKEQTSTHSFLAIGASDVSLMDMVSAYSAFSSGHQPKRYSTKGSQQRRIVIEDNGPVLEELLAEKMWMK
jgi:membrane peptidoglycan carboxypeptidase